MRKARRRLGPGLEELERRDLMHSDLRIFDAASNTQVAASNGNVVGFQLPHLEQDDRVHVSEDIALHSQGAAWLDTSINGQNFMSVTTYGPVQRREGTTVLTSAGRPWLQGWVGRSFGTADEVYANIRYTITRAYYNFQAEPLRLDADGSVHFSVVNNGQTPVNFHGIWTEVSLHWASGPRKEDIIPSPKLAWSGLDGAPGSRIAIDVPASVFSSNPPPDGATYLVAVIDIRNSVRETNEGDNVVSLVLPRTVNYSQPFVEFRKDQISFGGLVDSPFPVPFAPKVNLFYSRNGDLLGEHVFEGALGRVGAVWSFNFRNWEDLARPPRGATHLTVVLDAERRFIETNEDDNVFTTPIPNLEPTISIDHEVITLGLDSLLPTKLHETFAVDATLFPVNETGILEDRPLTTVALTPFESKELNLDDLALPRSTSGIAVRLKLPRGMPEKVRTNNTATAEIPTVTIPKIPEILHNKEWTVAESLMRSWMRRSAAVRTAGTRGPDYNLPFDRKSISVKWVLDRLTENEGRLFDTFISKDSFSRPAVLAELQKVVVAKFNVSSEDTISFGALPPVDPGTDRRLFPRTTAEIEELHMQHVDTLGIRTDIRAEWQSNRRLSHLDASLHGFSFHLLLGGTAVRDGSQIMVTIDRASYYLYDSYDFNNDLFIDQPLGCWAFPDVVRKREAANTTCFSNEDFRKWRGDNNKGGDFNILSDIKSRRLHTPAIYTFAIASDGERKSQELLEAPRVTVTQVGKTDVGIRWDSEGYATTFGIAISTDNQNWRRVQEMPGSAREYLITGLDANTEYFLRVRAFDDSGRRTSNVIKVRTASLEIPHSPILSVSDIRRRQVDLKWMSDGVNILNYAVAISFDGRRWDRVTVLSSSERSYTVTGLTPGTTVYVRVNAIGVDGNEKSNVERTRTDI